MAHPNKHIREAIEYATENGWHFEKAGPRAHIYGTLRCVIGHLDCVARVHSTPRSPQDHAKRIRRKVDKCPG